MEPRAPRERPLRRRAVLTALAGLAMTGASEVGWRFEQARELRAWAEGAGLRAAALAHAGTMASGEQVTVLHGSGEHAVLVRVPGHLAHRGTDVVRVVDVLPVRDAVAVMPGGAWAIAARGGFVDASSAASVAACARQACVNQHVPGHGGVVQLTADGRALLEDGSIATHPEPGSVAWRVEPRTSPVVDLAGSTLSPCELSRDGKVRCERRYEPGGGEQQPALVLASSALTVVDPLRLASNERSGLVCVLGRAGAVACGVRSGGVSLIDEHPSPYVIEPIVLPGLTRASRLALSEDDLCVVDVGGALSCRSGPGRADATADAVGRRLSLTRSLDGVTDVALGANVGCVQQHRGDVRCWGDGVRDGGIVRRDTPVEVAGLDAVERLVAFRGLVCALQRGEVSCWGAWEEGWDARVETPRPRAVRLTGRIDGIAVVGGDRPYALCVSFVGGGVRCWRGDPLREEAAEVSGSRGLALRSLASADDVLCGLDGGARAWCIERFGFDEPVLRRVPTLDGYERLVTWGVMRCAARAGDLRCVDVALVPTAVHPADRSAFARATAAPGALVQTLEPFTPLPGDVARGREADSRQRALLGGVYATTPTSPADYDCRLGPGGRVACRWQPSGWDRSLIRVAPDEGEPAALVPGLDDAVELAVTADDLACARRASGRVVCWGRNVGGTLTAEGSAPLEGLEALMARAGR